uniref:DUF4220 domain-containing protein n=1 Tax=Oryza nivara TaxID=4536 RepID=A0A0E0GXF5_ORYNI
MLAAGRTPQEEELVTLWAAFMLLSAGMPDKMTAYALEDGALPIGKPDNDQILLVAHGNLHVTMGAFIDNLQYEHDAEEQEILPKTWDENRTLYKVVEMELSLMYDILYTKAAMVHTWGGYAIRVVFPFTGATAFLLFWFHSEDAYPPTVPIDKAKATLPPAPFPLQHTGRADPAEMMPPTKQIVRQRELEDADLNFSPACQESILIWHIAMDVFLLCSHQYSSLSKEVQAIKLLSDYMVFLVAVRPNMVPGLKLRSLYVAVGYALTNDDEILPKEGYHCNLTEKKEKLANRLKWNRSQAQRMRRAANGDPVSADTYWFRPEKASILYDKNIILSDGTSFAHVLLSRIGPNPYTPHHIDLNYTRYQRLIDMIPDLEDESNRAWVRFLVYTSVRCTRDSHAKQLACGGELTTIILISSPGG